MVFDPREFNAVVENGMIRPDEPLNLPDRTRLRVSIASIMPSAEDREKALQALRNISERGLFHSGGVKFTREQLHERD